MGVFSWLGRTFGIRDSEPWSEYYGGQSKSGQNVTVDTALQLSTVWACVGLVSRTISTLPLKVYERQEDGSRVPAPRHPIARVLREPNADLTAPEFWEAEVRSLLLWGNSFCDRVERSGQISSLNRLEPHRLKVFRDERNRLAFEYAEKDGQTRRLSERQVFVVRGYYMGGDLGISPVRYGCHSLGMALAADEASGRLYENGLHSNGFIKLPQVIKDKDQRDKFVQNWIKPLQGAQNAGKIGVLEGGMEWVEATMSSADAELLASRRFGVEEICRWFGVPPIMIGHAAQGQTMWGSGVEQINLQFLIHGIRPWLNGIEGAINKRLFAPEDRGRYYAEFNVEGLLRGDSTARAALYASAAQNGWMTRTEIREKENLPKRPEADELTAQSNLLPLDKLGQGGAAVPIPETANEE